MRYGLIGEKLGHSFSKIIHEKLCDYIYDLIPLKPEEVGPFLTERQFSAINVTIPYKETVLPYLSQIDPAARAIGAVNTVVNRDGTLYGYNTDFAGIEYLLDAHGFNPAGKKALVLGSGGTCKTACAVLRSRGAAQIVIVSRTPGPGRATYEQALAEHADAEFLINTTPVGMFPNLSAQPIDLAGFKKLEAVVDVIYNPLRTALLQQARALGIPCCNGLEMLVAQAKYAAEHFLDAELPQDAIARIHRQLCSQMKNIALIGMPSCGKTTTGKLLAERMGREFVDLDERIVRIAGMSIPRIFETQGEAPFRALEKQALQEVCGRTGLVISTGGGIIKDEDNIRLLRHNSAICFLDRALEHLAAGDPTRPLSSSAQAVAVLYAQRLPLYRALSDFTIDNNGEQADAVRRIEEKFYETACD